MLKYRTPDWKHVSWFYRFLYAIVRAPIKWFVPLRARGLERLPRNGGVILAPNHQTWADPIFVAAAMPRPSFFLGKSGLFKWRITNWFFRSNGVVPVFRGAREGNPEAYRFALERLAAGDCVMVFPEATRGKPGELLPGKTGAVRMALESGCPIVPVGLEVFRFWPLTKRIPRFGKGAYLSVGEPWTPDASLAKDDDAPHVLTDELMRRLGALVAECRAAEAKRETWRW